MNIIRHERPNSTIEPILHPETGQLGSYVPANGEFTIHSRRKIESYKRLKENERFSNYHKGKNYVACFHEPIKNLILSLSLTECGALLKLLPYLKFNNNGKLVNKNSALNQKDIQKILGKSKDATRDILNNLEKCSILFSYKEGKNKVYYINDTVHVIGKFETIGSFTKLFQGKIRELMDSLTLNEAGMLYKILPYFHYETYYLCSNPDESSPEFIEHMTREELSKAINHDVATVSKIMSRLQYKGIILSTRSLNTVRYLVHPDVMFRKREANKYTFYIRKMFSEHENKNTK